MGKPSECCCCGPDSYNMIYVNRQNGHIGKRTFNLRDFDKKKQRWLKNRVGSKPVDYLREHIFDIWKMSDNNFCVVANLSFSQDNPLLIPVDENIHGIYKINRYPSIFWKKEKVFTNFQGLNSGFYNPNKYSYRRCVITKNDVIIYMPNRYLVGVDTNGTELFQTELSNNPINRFNFAELRAGQNANKIICNARIQDDKPSDFPFIVTTIHVFSINGEYENTIVADKVINGIVNNEIIYNYPSLTSYGVIDDNIYCGQADSIFGTLRFQKRDSTGNIIKEILVNERIGNGDIWNRYVWIVTTQSTTHRLYIYDEDLNLIFTKDFPTVGIVETDTIVSKVILVENDGIYILQRNALIYKYSFDGELIWSNLYLGIVAPETVNFHPLTVSMEISSDEEIVVVGNTFTPWIVE